MVLYKLPMDICFADPNGRIILCNNRMRRLSFALCGHELQIKIDMENALSVPDRIMLGVLMVAIAVYVCVGLPNMNPGQLVLADMFSSGPKLTTLGAGIAVLVFVMLFAIVITSTGATFGVLMTLFSFANCLGDIVLCIIPFFLRKKYPHACRHAGFTMPLWVLYAMSVFAIVVAAYLSYSALLTLGATVWLLPAIFAVVFVAYVLLRIAYLKRQGRDLMAELKAPYAPFEEREAECAAMDAGK